MPIEFECIACLSVLKVPDAAAGKKARCPSCQTILNVPGELEPQPPAPQGPEEDWDDGAYSKAPVQPPASDWASPQGHRGDHESSPYYVSEDSGSPYAPPMSGGASFVTPQSDVERLKSQATAAGIVQLVVCTLGVLWAAMLLLGGFAESLNGRLDGDDIQVIFMGGGLVVCHGLGFVSGVCLIQKRNRGLALIGTLASMVAGLCCCLVPTLVNIFPLVVLLNANHRSFMR